MGLDALGGIDDEEGALAGGEGAADLVAEIYVTGGVNEVEFVGLAIAGGVAHADGGGLDGDAFLALEFHRIQNLLGGIAVGDGAG